MDDDPMSEDTTKLVLLNVSQVAEALSLSEMTVYRMINAGQLPAYRIGKSFRVSRDDLDAWLSERKVG